MLTVRKVIKRMFIKFPVYTMLSFTALILISLAPTIELYFFNRLISSITDEIMLNARMSGNSIGYLFIYLLWSLILPFVFRSIYEALSLRIQREMDAELASNALEQTLKSSIKNIESGEGVNSAFRASQTQSGGVQGLVNSSIEMVFAVIKGLSLIISLGLAGLGVFALVLLFSVFLFRISKKTAQMNLESNWELDEDRRKSETLFGTMISRTTASEMWLYGNRMKTFRKYKQQQHEIFDFENKYRIKIMKHVLLSDYLMQFCLMLLMLAFACLYFFRGYSASFCITAVYASQMLLGIANDVVQKIVAYKQQTLILDEYNKVFSWEEECRDTGERGFRHQIELKDVSYRYPSGKRNALDKINLTISRGEKIVLVGKNGTGKSTLIRLLLGYDLPTEGTYTIDGLNIKEQIRNIRDNASVMFQRFYRYNMNLKQNIVISEPSKEEDDEAIRESLEWAEITDMINGLKDGLNTQVIDGSLFSDGQWQRIAMARAFFRKRDIIFLDEPNSAVDALYEIKQYQKFMELMEGKTAVIVSHRLPICQLADRIVVMDEGRIIETGTHSELIEKRGVYYQMFASQSELYA